MKKGKKIAAFALSILALATFAVPAIASEPFFGASAQTIADFDVTDIETDLQDIDEKEYPADEDGETKVIRFQEYCYSLYAENSAEYGLYLYVYNPTEKAIGKTENTVNMAVSYDKNGEPSAYENIPLTLLDKTDNNRFIKFKVTDASSFLKRVNAYAALHNGERRYDVADINLFFADGSPAEATNASKTYVWTGFGVGMNNNAESSLACNVESLETLTLDVKHTYFRDTTGENVQSTETVHSVYFAVPNDVLDAYGALYRIHAEYLSAHLKPSLVLGDKDVYNEVSKYLWRDMSTHNESLDYQIFGGLNQITMGPVGFSSEYSFNYKNDGVGFWIPDRFADWLFDDFTYIFSNSSVSPLYMLFGTDSWAENSADSFTVSSETLKKEMLNSGKNPLSTENIIGADGEYSRAIFSHVDDKKTDITLTADDTFDLTKTVYNDQWFLWDIFGNGHGYGSHYEKVFTELPVIYKIDEGAFLYEDYVNAQNLLVAEEDFPDLKKAYINATANNESLFLFRYRVTDYEAHEAYIFKEKSEDEFELVSTNGYFFEQDVDLLFDIIDVMFLDDEGTETVLGVVSKPTDYAPSATRPSNTTTDKTPIWVWVALGIVGYLLLCYIGHKVYPTVPFFLAVFHGLWYVITLPFRGIVWIFRKIKGRDR